MTLSITSDINSSRVGSDKSDYVPAVLVVGSGLSGGGAEARLSRLAPSFFDGHVDLAILSGDSAPDNLIAGQIFCLQWKSRLSYPRILFALSSIIRKGNYDVVIAFGMFPIVLSALALIGFVRKPKFIVSEITSPITALRNSNCMRRKIYALIQELLYRRGDLITANSIDGLIETCQLSGVNHTTGIRLPNIVDSEKIRKEANHEAPFFVPYRRFLICVGRLDFMKRLDTVIDAYGLLKDTGDCGLVIVGDGSERRVLEAKVSSLGLRNSITFTGRLKNPFPLLKNASAFVLASEYEGFSNSVIEAMFCDVPVITSFCSTDAREMCDSGAALGFEIGDKFRLAENMSIVINDRSLAQKLIGNAQIYRRRHELNRAIPVYENAVRRVLAGRVNA